MYSKKGLFYWAIYIITLTTFTLITVHGLNKFIPGDEHVYHYMGKVLLDGTTPYKDFFLAHPPLHIYLIAIIIKIFGFNIIALKLLPFLSTIITSLFLLLITKKRFSHLIATITVALYLTTYSTLFNSVFSFGISIATMFLIIGIYFIYNRQNYLVAGIFFGFAGITRFLTLIPIMIIFGLTLLKNRKKFIRLLIGFSIIFILLNLILIILVGKSYIESVFKFHLLKSPLSLEKFSEYFNTLKLNWIVFVLPLLIFFTKINKKIFDILVISIIYLTTLVIMGRLFSFYFVPIIPFISILAGYSIVLFLSKIKNKKILIPVIIIMISLFSWNLLSDYSFLTKVGYKSLDRFQDINNLINSRFPENLEIFGDDSSVTLFALSTNRKILHNYIDTNPAVFKTNLVDIDKTIESINTKNFIFIARDTQGIIELIKFREFLNSKCIIHSAFKDKLEGSFLIYECNKEIT